MSEDNKRTVRPNTENYETGKREDGSRFIDNGDDVSTQFRDLSLEEIYPIVNRTIKETGEKSTIQSLKDKYSHLNPGMRRMVLGNRMRGMIRKLEKAA
jgi:hypothetical protein